MKPFRMYPVFAARCGSASRSEPTEHMRRRFRAGIKSAKRVGESHQRRRAERDRVNGFLRRACDQLRAKIGARNAGGLPVHRPWQPHDPLRVGYLLVAAVMSNELLLRLGELRD